MFKDFGDITPSHNKLKEEEEKISFLSNTKNRLSCRQAGRQAELANSKIPDLNMEVKFQLSYLTFGRS